MTYFLFITLTLVTITFYMLEVAFKSFSRISLAGFLEDLKGGRLKKIDLVEKYELVLNALAAFSFFLQLGLFIFGFTLLATFVPNLAQRVALLILAFLASFNVILYTLSFIYRESILNRLIYLIPLAWVFFYPFNLFFSAFTRENPEEKEEVEEEDDLSEKELATFIAEGTKEGVFEKEDQEMIASIIGFGDTLVKEIMTPRVDMVYVDIEAGLDELIAIINEHKKSRYPVISGQVDNIEGFILAKDVFDYWQKDDFNVRKIIRPPFFIPETMRVLELLKELQKSKQKFAAVVDEFGGISGLATMEDIIEEIVGEIHDEYDEDTEQIVKEKDTFLVKGDTDIWQLNEVLDGDLDEDEDYQTVAGLISFKLGRIPRPGDAILMNSYTFKVVETEKNRLKKVKIFKSAAAPDPGPGLEKKERPK